MTIKQVSAFAENRSGGILDVIRSLGKQALIFAPSASQTPRALEFSG